MAEPKPASKILRVLILDDSPDDAEAASAVLRQAGYMLKSQRFETGVAVEQSLDSNSWDLILCAHGVPSLPVRQIISSVSRKQPFTPVLVLARRIPDEEIRALMQAGARDVVIKGQWGRLLPAVDRELAVAAERRNWVEMREALENLEARYRTMIEASIEPISYVQDGMHMDANPAYLRLFGYDIESLKETPLLNLIDKTDQSRFKQALRKPEGADKAQEFQAVSAAGQRLTVQVALTPLLIHGEPCVQVVATDVSKRKALETKLQSMHQRDPLTGLYNRPYFTDALDAALKTPGGALIGLNVGNLAALNQMLGHSGCDRILTQLARQLRDLSGNQLVARVAGGQFAVLLDRQGVSGGEPLTRRIREMLDTLHDAEGGASLQPDVRLVYVPLDGSVRDRQEVLAKTFPADTIATQAATTSPRPAHSQPAQSPPPQPVAATPTPTPKPAAPAMPVAPAAMASPAPAAAHTPPPLVAPARDGDWSEALSQALAHNQMQLQFQPIINLHGEPRFFYEAQLVMHCVDGRVVTPNQYLAAAEKSGLAAKIDRSLMLNVIDTLAKYRLEGRPGTVFVTLSSTAAQDTALLTAIQMHMKATGLNPADIIIQLGESAFTENFEAARAFANKARAIGVGMAIHQFTNQAVNMELLADLTIDYYAIDCGPQGLPPDDLYGAIDAVLALDRQIIARNIEDADLFSTLFSRGVHYVQGDYLQPATSGLDYSFEAEQTLTSDEPLGPSWRAAG